MLAVHGPNCRRPPGEFLGHYHKRSNVESTFAMIKGKFRGHVRSKTPVAMVNETLCKIICHNISRVGSGVGGAWNQGVRFQEK
jgi:transposase